MASQYLLPQNTVFSLLPIAPCVVSDQHHHHVHVGIRILWTFSVYLFTICMRFTPNRQKSATIILARSDKCSHCLIFMSVIRLLIVLNCADPVEWKCEWTKWICVCERERETITVPLLQYKLFIIYSNQRHKRPRRKRPAYIIHSSRCVTLNEYFSYNNNNPHRNIDVN